MKNSIKKVAVIGAGPVGLAAASHLLERGFKPILFEAGPEAGHAIRQWEHVRLFSPWKFNIDTAADRMLRKKGWSPPDPEELPTGREFLDRYLIPLAETAAMKGVIRLNNRVADVSRRDRDKVKNRDREKIPFILKVDQNGIEKLVEADAVIDTSGTWFQPNPVGSGGIKAPGENRYHDHIFYGIPDPAGRHREKYADKRVAVIGGGHSAMQAALDLMKLQDERPQTEVIWLMRKTNLQDAFGGGKEDALPARGELGNRTRRAIQYGNLTLTTPFLIRRIEKESSGSTGIVLTGLKNGVVEKLTIDEIIATTGFRPNLEILREIRTSIDPAIESVAGIAEMIDPNIHSCGTVPPHGVEELKHPEENFFIAGMKSYGRAPTFLMATGYEQVRSIAAWLAGDTEAALQIDLNFPETGVCSTGTGKEECCGISELTLVTAESSHLRPAALFVSARSRENKRICFQTVFRDSGQGPVQSLEI